MSDVAPMAADQMSDPVMVLILGESGDGLFHDSFLLRCALNLARARAFGNPLESH
ncbi:MAG: hypothetical protein ACI81R_001374 [Bradymonadia bacterium]|jgi:hypothetical protein